ncbi:MAG: IS5 family transposase [Gammaproteobacteria bacterium]|nr:IS5 family transposase [Gammaproteobacteria bacterium]
MFREFAQIDLGEEPVPDETTILHFRHLLEKHTLGGELFDAVNRYLAENGMSVTHGTMVDATIINAPSSTKNKERQRDPDRRQAKKGNQGYFGMKAPIGVDSKSRLIHSVVATAANTHDSQVLGDLLRGEETRVYGDSAYRGQGRVIKKQAPRANDVTQAKARRHHPLTKQEKSRNKNKSRLHARVEHVFHVITRPFGCIKVRYQGLDKNANPWFACCALVNLVLMKKRLLRVSSPCVASNDAVAGR